MRTGTVRASTLRQMETLNMDRAAPVLYPHLQGGKHIGGLEAGSKRKVRAAQLISDLQIFRKSRPKLMQGDHQAPEGFYDITPDQMNPNSSEYLGFNTGFPNAFDRSLGRTGSFLMVHGGCRSAGCYAMTDYAMEEIYGLVDEAFKGGQEKVQLEASLRNDRQKTSRDTRLILICHFGRCSRRAVMRSWRRSDHRELAVCDRRYVFNPVVAGNLDPSAPCPFGIDSTSVAGAEQSPQSASASIRHQTIKRSPITATIRLLRK